MVGMEIHVELATRSKMFTAAANVAHPDHYDAQPNTLCDPVVLGMPGVLPVINKRAVEMSMLVGLALGSKIARHTKWDRKSYYYPDLPKSYQISQYDQPLCIGGGLAIPVTGDADGKTKTIRLIRAPPGRRRRQAAARSTGRCADRLFDRRPQPCRHAASRNRHGA